jgi:phosphoglucomutase
VGNTLNANHPVVREFVTSVLRYWVMNMHVDGFRFDLASVLGRDVHGNILREAPLLEGIAEDPILRDVKIIAEAWDAGGAYQVGDFSSTRWTEWNGRFRDDVRRFWVGDAGMMGSFARRICGSSDLYQSSGKGPARSLNFVTCHDGFTLNDLVSYKQKHNYENGEFNRDGADFNNSDNCGVEGPSQDPRVEGVRIRLIKNFLLTLFISRGIPMLLGGDEFRRSQRGNNNAYCQDNEVSWFDWSLLEKNKEIHRFSRGMIAFRRAHPVSRKEDFYTDAEIKWFALNSATPDWEEQEQNSFACLILGQAEPDLFLLFNADTNPIVFFLHCRPVRSGVWRSILPELPLTISLALGKSLSCRARTVFGSNLDQAQFFYRTTLRCCMTINPAAGKPADPSILVNVPKLVTAYYELQPDPSDPGQRVVFGTSGHRGSAFDVAFNEWHILAITQAICDNRKQQNIDGPLFLGMDTHALSEPAFASAMEVLAANSVEVMISEGTPYTPTPAVSHAILVYNRARASGLADGIVITPSHNPPDDGGFKYDPPHGGPADSNVTSWIELKANDFLERSLDGVRQTQFTKALHAPTTHKHDFLSEYVSDLNNVVDMNAVRDSKINLGVDPLGGAGIDYWPRIAEKYGLDLTIVNQSVDPTFRFMSVDWDGKIRMDPSSPYAMQRLIALKDKFDIAFASDTDHDRHGPVTKTSGLLPPNHYLSACIRYLFANRPDWSADVAVGKTVVSSSMIDRVSARLGRRLYEVPVGFKYFVEGLLAGHLGFGGEGSAGSSFLRRDGSVWTTDKDGIIPCLLSAEITARVGKDPGEIYRELASELGDPVYERIDAPASSEQKAVLAKLSSADIHPTEVAGQPILKIQTCAPGDGNTIGGIKLIAKDSWFAARPSGTEEIYKIYAESFLGQDHLRHIQEEARAIVAETLARSAQTA